MSQIARNYPDQPERWNPRQDSKPRPKSEPPPWFGKALAQATAEDHFNALSLEKKAEVESSIQDTGAPPKWFLDELKALGLRFKEPLT